MTGDIERRPDSSPAPARISGRQQWADELMAWAAAAQRAHEIATVLADTSFVPKAMQHRPGEVTGAILTGMELDVPIMWALGNIDLIEGRPGISAKGLRALILRAGHDIWTEETTASRAIVCGRRKGSQRVERSKWDLDRARKANLLGKKAWREYPQDMLLNRATAEVFRLVAPDELIGVAYTVDELGGDEGPSDGAMPTVEEMEPAAKPRRRTARRADPPPVEPNALPADLPAPDSPAPPDEDRPTVVSEVGEKQARQTMGNAGFEVVDVIDGVEEPAADMPPTLAPTCDDDMPHDMRYPAPRGCPPNCPTRVAAERPAEGDDQAVDSPATEMMTDAQRRRMHLGFRDVGLVERDERIAFTAHIIGRQIDTSSELTKEEASEVISALVDEGLDDVRRKLKE